MFIFIAFVLFDLFDLFCVLIIWGERKGKMFFKKHQKARIPISARKLVRL